MIKIVNKGGTDPDPMGERNYELYINDELIATFTHKRRDGLPACLRAAADAASHAAGMAMYERLHHIVSGDET